MNDKLKLKKAKLAYRESVGRGLPQKEKKKKTGEFELFKKIAEERRWNDTDMVKARHITPEGFICHKFIRLEDLTITNFSHILNKGMHKDKRLDPDNIEIVSTAWHFFEHNQQIIQIDYPN